MQRPKLLLFDLGGVLVDNVAFGRLSENPQIHLTEAEIKSKWLASSVVRSFELGVTSPAAFAKSFVEEWNISVKPEDFLSAFSAWPRGFYPGAIELLVHLRRRFRVACLSNSNSVHWSRFDLSELFDVALSSHLLGAIKPDALCFDRAIQECCVPKEEVVFFDDSLENVTAARKFAMQAFHVCGLEPGIDLHHKIVKSHVWSEAMPDLVDELSQRARELGPEDRARLAEELLASLEVTIEPEVDAVWDEELRKRIAEVESDAVKLVPADEVFARVRRTLR